MLQVEFRINGKLISFLHIVNRYMVPSADENKYLYEWELYRPEHCQPIRRGTISHIRSNGAEELVQLILAQVRRQDGKAQSKKAQTGQEAQEA